MGLDRHLHGRMRISRWQCHTMSNLIVGFVGQAGIKSSPSPWMSDKAVIN